MAKFRTHYDNLKVACNAPDSVIRAAYKALMQQYHPDKYQGNKDEALKIAKIIKQSYDVLIDPAKRAEHDAWIKEQEAKEEQMRDADRKWQAEQEAHKAEQQRQAEETARQAHHTEERAERNYSSPPPSFNSTPVQEKDGMDYAGFWKRFAAAIIDAAVICAFGIMVLVVSYGSVHAMSLISGHARGFLANYLENGYTALLFWLYFSGMEASVLQATLGKMLLGIKVTDLHGNRVSFGRATGRHFTKLLVFAGIPVLMSPISDFLFWLFLLLGCVMVAFTEKKQGAHDMMASCVVIDAKVCGVASPPIPESEKEELTRKDWSNISAKGFLLAIVVISFIFILFAALNENQTYGPRTTTVSKQQGESASSNNQADAKGTYNHALELYKQGRYAEALPLYKQLAEQGFAEAQFILGFMFDRGQGVAQDSNQAVYWFRKAAAQGHVLAQSSLGFMYDKGRGVAQDYNQAVSWYSKAAEQGLAVAQYNIGFMYYKGQGVTKDYNQAVYWFQKSAEQGYTHATEALSRLTQPNVSVPRYNNGYYKNSSSPQTTVSKCDIKPVMTDEEIENCKR